MKIETEKNVVVSTSHVTLNDMTLLEDIARFGGANMVVYNTESWTLVYLPTVGEACIDDFSEAFKRLLNWAANLKDKEFTFLKLDADGPVLEEFETFIW